jgi:hypothetical protein
MSEQPYRLGTRQLIAYSAVLVVSLAVVTLPATVAALALHRVLLSRLGRSEHLAIFGTATLCAVIAPGVVFVDPVLWTVGLVGLNSVPTLPPPVLGAVILGAWYASLWGAVSSTLLWGKVAARSSSVFRVFRSPFQHESLVPSASEKKGVALVSVPGGIIRSPESVLRTTGAELGVGTVAVGLDRKRTPVLLTEQEIGMHGMILGSTGSGKTETIKVMAAALCDLGWPGMIVDLKEDTSTGGLRDFLSTYAHHHALPFQELALSDPNPKFWFNPLEGMGPDEARDTILSLTEYDDSYWKNINLKMLGQIVTLLFDAHYADSEQVPYPSIIEIGRILSSSDLPASTRKLRGIVASRTGAVNEDRYSALIHPSPDEAKSAIGFGAKLTQIYNTQAGRTVLSPDPRSGRPLLDVTQGGLTYVGLDTQGKRDLSMIVSSAVLQRMSVFAAQRTTGTASKSQKRFVIIDEANVINRPIVKTILQKARAAGLVLILCTQGPEDWIDINGDDWSAMAQNVNFAVIMSQGSPRSAELCAELVGEKVKLQVSQQIDMQEYGAKGSYREAVDFIVPPHELRGLSIGEAVLRVNKPTERVTWMAVKQRDPTAHA